MCDNKQAADQVVLDPPTAAFRSDETTSDLGVTHFIGIGGAGMSVLAEMLHEQGVTVQGSDRESGAKTDRLQALGIDVRFGQRESNIEGVNTVVYSSAIKADNPEIQAAHALGCRIVHRSDILSLLMNAKRAVTVAGAHGKTTTSSMLAHILVHAGTGTLADPSYAIGGSIQGKDGTVLDGGHAGAGDVLVAEADESDGSFMKYHPEIAIVTNAEADHLDHYGDAAHYRAAFAEHVGNARRAIIMCVDDEGALAVLRALDAATARKVIAYSTQPAQSLGDLNGASFVRILSESTNGNGQERFTLELPESLASRGDAGNTSLLNVSLAIPGIHNARNATAAIIAAVLLGVLAREAADAAATFRGAARRFDIRGCEHQVTVVDDYAHHPTEIAALLDAARRRYPTQRIHVLFQPHLFSRTKFFANEFAAALGKADDVIVTGIFPARERQEDYPDVNASTIVSCAPENATARMFEAVDNMDEAAHAIASRAHAGDVIFTVGAGDITRMDPVILDMLRDRDDAGIDA